MKIFLKKLANNLVYFLIGGALFATAGLVYAVQVSVPQATTKGDLPTGLATGNYQLLHPGADGTILIASSTSANGLTWGTASSSGGSGISSLNGLVAATQTFATTSSGSTFTVNSSGSTHTFTFPSGTTGLTTRWLTNSSIGTGVLIDNGTVAGVNASSSTVNLNVKGTTTLNPFDVTSSTNISLFRIGVNGSAMVGTTTPSATMMIQGTSTQPSLDLLRVASSTGILVLQVTNGNNINIPSTTATALLGTDANKNLQSLTITNDTNVTGSVANSALTLGWTGTLADSRIVSAGVWNGKVGTSTNLTTNFIPIVTGANTLGNSTFSQSGGTTFINGATPILDGGGDFIYNVIQSSGANVILQTPTSTAVVGNFIQAGGVTPLSTSTNITGLQFVCGMGLYYLNSTSSLTTNIKFPDLNQIATGAATGCGGGPLNIWSSAFAQQFQYNASTSSPATVSASGSGETLFFAMGSGATSNPGQSVYAVGQFVASTTVSGATTTGMSFNAHLQGFQLRATNPTMQGQFLMASSTSTGLNPEWTVGNILGGTGITVTTSTAAQITVAIAPGVVNNVSTGTAGNNFNITTSTNNLVINLPNASASNSGQLTSTDWGTFNAKLGTTNVSGTSGQAAYFTGNNTVNGSANYLWDNTARALLINTTTPALANFQVTASTTQTTDIFRVSSTSGLTYLTVGPSGSATLSSLNSANCDVFAVAGSLACGTNGAGGAGGSGVPSSTPFTNGFIPYASSTPTFLTDSPLRANGQVVGVNATSSTVNFLVQGTGTNSPFQVNSSTGVSLLRVSTNGSVGIGTTTNTATLYIQGTSTLPAVNVFTVASSNGTPMFQVGNDNNVVVSNEAIPSFLAGTQKMFTVVGQQASGVARIVRDVGLIPAASTGYVTYGVTDYSASTTLTSWPNLTGPVQLFAFATSGQETTLGDIGALRNGNDLTGELVFRPYTANAQVGQVTLSGLSSDNYFNIKAGAGGTGSVFNVASSNSASLFQVNTDPTQATVYVQGSLGNTTNIFNVASSNASSYFFVVRSSGLVGVGSSTPSATLTVQGTTTLPTTSIFVVASSSGGQILTVGANTPTAAIFNIASATGVSVYNFNIDNTVGFGTTSLNKANLIVQGTSTQPSLDLFVLASSTSNDLFRVKANGTIFATGTASSGSSQTGYWCYDGSSQLIRDSAVCIVSALKFKKDIKDLTVGLDELNKFRFVSYYKKEPLDNNDAGEQVGVIADEALKIDPRLVTLDSEGQPHGFRYEQFTAVIGEAVQELDQKVENLTIGKIKRSAEENWQWLVICLLALYVIYNEWDKRRE